MFDVFIMMPESNLDIASVMSRIEEFIKIQIKIFHMTIIIDFNEFLKKEYKIISLGISPSGHIHPGFLLVLSIALIYLKQHPTAVLKITNCDLSRPTNVEKHEYIPLRYRKAFFTKRLITATTHKELLNFTNLLCNEFDAATYNALMRILKPSLETNEFYQIKRTFPATYREIIKPALDTGNLELIPKIIQNEVTNESIRKRVLIFKFSDELKKPPFRTKISRILLDYNQSQKAMQILEKNYLPENPQLYTAPIYGVCPRCKRTVGAKAKITRQKERSGYNLAFQFYCEDKGNINCNTRTPQFIDINWGLDNFEYDFLFDPVRDLYEPFITNCHIFGGDYVENIKKIQNITSALAKETDKIPDYYVAPIIMNGNRKLSKSDISIPLAFRKDAKIFWKTIIKYLYTSLENNTKISLQIQASELFRKTND